VNELDCEEGSIVISDESPLFNVLASNDRITLCWDTACCLGQKQLLLRSIFVCIIAVLVFKLLDKPRNDIVKVSHNPDVRDLEYWRIRILDILISILTSFT